MPGKRARPVRREAARKRPGFILNEHGTSPGSPPYPLVTSRPAPAGRRAGPVPFPQGRDLPRRHPDRPGTVHRAFADRRRERLPRRRAAAGRPGRPARAAPPLHPARGVGGIRARRRRQRGRLADSRPAEGGGLARAVPQCPADRDGRADGGAVAAGYRSPARGRPPARAVRYHRGARVAFPGRGARTGGPGDGPARRAPGADHARRRADRGLAAFRHARPVARGDIPAEAARPGGRPGRPVGPGAQRARRQRRLVRPARRRDPRPGRPGRRGPDRAGARGVPGEPDRRPARSGWPARPARSGWPAARAPRCGPAWP